MCLVAVIFHKALDQDCECIEFEYRADNLIGLTHQSGVDAVF